MSIGCYAYLIRYDQGYLDLVGDCADEHLDSHNVRRGGVGRAPAGVGGTSDRGVDSEVVMLCSIPGLI